MAGRSTPSILGCVLLTYGSTAADPGLAKSIRDHAAETEKRSAGIKCRYTSATYSRDGDCTWRSERRHVLSRDHALYVYRDVDPRNGTQRTQVASGWNSTYSFSLVRKQEGWVIHQLHSSPAAGGKRPRDVADVPFAFDGPGLTYREALDNPATRALSGDMVEWRGRKHRELVVETPVLFPDMDGPVVHRYGLFVRPEQPGVVCGVRRYDPDNLTRWLREDVIEYEPGSHPFPGLKSVTTYVTDKTADYEPWRYSGSEIIEYTRSATPFPEAEFTLAAFGLPEPKTIPPSSGVRGIPGGDGSSINYISRSPPPSPASTAPSSGRGPFPWPWAIVGGVVLSAAGFYARSRRNRPKPPQAPAPPPRVHARQRNSIRWD